MIVCKPPFVISNVAKFHVNLNLNITVLCMFLSSILIMANLEISSMNGASTFINLCSFGFNTINSFGKIGMDAFKKLKQQSPQIYDTF